MSIARKILMGSSGGKKSTYVDDVFSTYVYTGTGSAKTITNGIDLSGEGGMTWIKRRNGQSDHVINDTIRGAGDALFSNNSNAEETGRTDFLSAFNSNGFSIGTDNYVNNNGSPYASWSFRKAPGFFDVVKFSVTNSSNQRVSHSLKSVPGLILFKRLNGNQSWIVYHRDLGPDAYLQLDTTSAKKDSQTGYFGPNGPTATDFGIKSNAFFDYGPPPDEVIAYVFAGGASTAATARSVDFDGSGDYLTVADSDDFSFGSGAFTIEAWIKPTTITDKAFIAKWYSGQYEWFFGTNGEELKFAYSTNGSGYTILDSGYNMKVGQWQHIAVTRDSSSKIRIFVNGIHRGATHNASATFYNGSQHLDIAHNSDSDSWQPTAKISNVRIVKGTAVYTSSFRPPTEPLTNITNTKLLCCNNSSTTGSTVTPGTITANGNPTASSDSPFDDSESFKFGEEEDQNIIKCGSYIGNGSTNGPEINLGFEPQWILIKRSSGTESWMIFDAMRGMTTQAGNDHDLRADLNNGEGDVRDYIDITPTGFKQVNTQLMMNGNGSTYVYMAIRRPDGYVGKPAEAGTDVFAMDTASGSSVIPTWDSGFPVDFRFHRTPGTSVDWYTGARLMGGGKWLATNSSNAQANISGADDDSNEGFGTGHDSSWQAWMWKRHAGFDVVTYKGNSTNRLIRHNLSIAPEMMWIKQRDNSYGWGVYHKGLNGGSSPENYYLVLDENYAEHQVNNVWNNIAPTATDFSLGSSDRINYNNKQIIAFLFASVAGISKVGSYVGQGSDLTVEFGFSPRFLMVKRVDSTGDWNVFDTVRGLDATSNDKELRLNNTNAQSNHEVGEPTSTGFTFACGGSHDTCHAGGRWIYYAHA